MVNGDAKAMLRLTDKQAAEYFHRSYTAVDGLWFLKVEERLGFDSALDIDDDVWKVLPKIQARLLRSILKTEKGISALLETLTTKLDLEGFEFRAEKRKYGFDILVTGCPWHNLMIRSGRFELSEKVGSLICNTENSVWASEFGDDITFELKGQICKGGEHCLLKFREG
jgi:hypothetical protein